MKKRTILFYVLLWIALVGMMSTTSCKRNSVDEPTVQGPAGFRIILSGTANPSTLFVPENKLAEACQVIVTALNNDGTPVVGKQVVFQESLGYGYFNNYDITTAITTNSNGVAGVNFYIPAGADIRASVITNIIATLVDDGRLDSERGTVTDSIPVKIMPYLQQGFAIKGNVLTMAGNGVSEVLVSLTGDTGYSSGISVTTATGRYRFFVEGGWTGAVTPSMSGAAFTPAEYSLANVYADRDDLDFVMDFSTITDTLATDVADWTVEPEGGTQVINTFNSAGDTSICYTIIPNSSWLTVSATTGCTPGTFSVTADENTETASRSGVVNLTVTNNGEAASVAVNVTQSSYTTSPDAELEVIPTTITVPSAGSDTTNPPTVAVRNSGSTDSIPFLLDVSDQSWIHPSTFTGSADINGTTFTVTVDENLSGAARQGTITVKPTSTGSKLVDTVITITQDTGPVLGVDLETLTFTSAAGSQSVTATNIGDNTPISFTLSNSATWLTADPPYSGTTPSTITISADANATGSTRTTTLFINYTVNGSSQTKSISISQSG